MKDGIYTSRQLYITSNYSYILIYASWRISTRYLFLCLLFGSSPDTNHHKTLVSNRVKGGEGIKGYNEDTMNTIKLGKLAKDLKNCLHFIKFFWFAMFTRNDYSNTCQIKIKANSGISFWGVTLIEDTPLDSYGSYIYRWVWVLFEIFLPITW